MPNHIEELSKLLAGEIKHDEKTLAEYSHDTSLFEVKPQGVIYPKGVKDIKSLVNYIKQNKSADQSLSLTARSAGTDITGGPINDSFIVDCTKYLNHIGEVSKESTVVEPGVLYQTLEQTTLEHNLYLPSYPISKNLCAIGGMIGNNSGGEKTLKYGKTANYVNKLKVVLSDGNEHTFSKLDSKELADKLNQTDFEGSVYKKIHELIETNYRTIKEAEPNVSRNSSGYNVWDVWDIDNETFDLTKLFIGSQGTLGIITEATLQLVDEPKHVGMMVIHAYNLSELPELISSVNQTQPSSFEAFDDHSLKMGLKFLPRFIPILGFQQAINTGFHLMPQFMSIAQHRIPALTLLVEYESDSQSKLNGLLSHLHDRMLRFNVQQFRTNNKQVTNNLWTVRREITNLQRQHASDKYAAPFIDDIIVKPEFLPDFLPRLHTILQENSVTYTISGHIGDGCFHIIPLMDLNEPEEKEKIFKIEEEVNSLVFEFQGSMSAEHNDGLIRGHYLKKMYGEEMFKIFEEIKNIFDPENIFNPHKKTDATSKFAHKHMRKSL